MNKQIGFSEFEYNAKRKKTRREIFLERMEELIPLEIFCDCIRPHYWVKGNGRPPIELKVMVKMYLISQWYNLSDESCEDLVYENQAVRRYVGIDLAHENAPDRTTLCKFRALLEKHRLNAKIFETLNDCYRMNGVILTEGAIIDATIIEAPDSKKNKEKTHLDREMSIARKNLKFHYGFKAHIAVDKASGLVTAVAVTTAKTADIEAASEVLTGEEKEVYADAGYIGLDQREEVCAKFKDTENPEVIRRKSHKKGKRFIDKIRKDVSFNIARKRSQITKTQDEAEQERMRSEEQSKARIRYKVEHSFHIVKDIFNFRKTRQRGLQKNLNRLFMLFCLTNIYFVMQKSKKMTNQR